MIINCLITGCVVILLGLFPTFSYSTEKDTSYWESVIAAENLFVKGQSDSSVASYVAIFNRFGIPQLKCWLNAYHISKFDLNGKYSDTLTKLFQQKGSFFYLKKYVKHYRVDYLSDLRLDTVKKRNNRAYIKLSRGVCRPWRKLERDDHRLGSFPVKNIEKRDAISHRKLVELYRLNNDKLPTKMEMMELQIEPYWLIFRQAGFNQEEKNRTLLDSILMNSLASGRISPTDAQFQIVDDIMFRKIPQNKMPYDSYKNDSEFLVDWLNVSHCNSLEEVVNKIGINKLGYINQLRSMIYLEPITDDYLKKRKVFKREGLYAR